MHQSRHCVRLYNAAMALPTAVILAAALRTLVLPFDNLSASLDTDWYRGAIAETIAAHLRAAGEEVVSVEAVHRELAERHIAPGDPMTRDLLVAVAWELGADRIIVGGFDTIDHELHVTADVRSKDGTLIAVLDDHDEVKESRVLMNRFARNLFRVRSDSPPRELQKVAARRQALRFDALKSLSQAWLESDPERRRKLVQQAVSNDPNYVEARLWVADLLMADPQQESGLSRRIVSLLGSIPSEEPFYPQAYFGMGVAYLLEDELVSAKEIFQNLAGRFRQQESGPVRVAVAPVWNNLGVIRLRLGELEEAVDAFEQAYELDASDPNCLFNLSFAYWRMGKGRQAFEHLTKLTALNPLDAEAFWLLAAASQSQALAYDGEIAMMTALTLMPSLGELDAATVAGLERPILRWSREPSPLIPEWFDPSRDYLAETTRLGVALAFAEADNAPRAIQLLQQELYHEPGSMEARLQLATLYRERGELSLSVGELQVALWHEPLASIHWALASVYEEMEEFEQALEQVERVLALEPEHVEGLSLQKRIAARIPE